MVIFDRFSNYEFMSLSIKFVCYMKSSEQSRIRQCSVSRLSSNSAFTGVPVEIERFFSAFPYLPLYGAPISPSLSLAFCPTSHLPNLLLPPPSAFPIPPSAVSSTFPIQCSMLTVRLWWIGHSTCPQCLDSGVGPISPFDLYTMLASTKCTMHGRRVFILSVFELPAMP